MKQLQTSILSCLIFFLLTALSATPRAHAQVGASVEVRDRQFILKKKLHSGKQGTAYVAKAIARGNEPEELVVIKLLTGAAYRSNAQREIANYTQLQGCSEYNPHWTRMLGAEEDGSLIVLEMASMSLAKELEDSGPMDEEEAKQVVRQVLDGLAALHDHGIAHHDLKTVNILLFQDGSEKTYKLADFGDSVAAEEGSRDQLNDMIYVGHLIRELTRVPRAGEINYSPELRDFLTMISPSVLGGNGPHMISVRDLMSHPWLQ